MKNVKLTNIKELAAQIGDMDTLRLEMKRIQSVKCRLKKQKGRADYETEMTKVVKYEQALKEVRDMFEPKGPTVTTMTIDDVKLLNYDETIRAIKSIQSKKCNTRWLVPEDQENIEYNEACRIERMLLEHKKNVKPIEDNVVKKSDLNNMIEHLRSLNLTTDELLERMKDLI